MIYPMKVEKDGIVCNAFYEHNKIYYNWETKEKTYWWSGILVNSNGLKETFAFYENDSKYKIVGYPKFYE